jgi:phage shock protein E
MQAQTAIAIVLAANMRRITMAWYARFLTALGAALIAMGSRGDVPADAVWIDVRSPGEYSQGHLEQASNIPWDGIEAGIQALKLDRDTPIYLYCASGYRSEVARERLQRRGYTRVTNAGGLEDARKLSTE